MWTSGGLKTRLGMEGKRVGFGRRVTSCRCVSADPRNPRCLRLGTLHRCVTTVHSATFWAASKGYQFLSSWSINKFLLVTQGDLKVTRVLCVRCPSVVVQMHRRHCPGLGVQILSGIGSGPPCDPDQAMRSVDGCMCMWDVLMFFSDNNQELYSMCICLS